MNKCHQNHTQYKLSLYKCVLAILNRIEEGKKQCIELLHIALKEKTNKQKQYKTFQTQTQKYILSLQPVTKTKMISNQQKSQFGKTY